MRRRLTIALCASLIALSPVAAGEPTIDVNYGGEADLDACTTLASVRGLDPDGDNFLAVRAGPGSKYKMIDKLKEFQPVFLCDARGSWIGIVYSKDGEDCEVSSPVEDRQPYDGPCDTGWVFKKYVKVTAG